MASPKCAYIYPDGRPCGSYPIKTSPLCFTHTGGLASVSAKGAAVKAEKNRAKKEKLDREVLLGTLGLDARLRLEAGEREGELVAQLLKLALGGDRQALLAIFDRMDGRAVARVETALVSADSPVETLSDEDLRRLLA